MRELKRCFVRWTPTPAYRRKMTGPVQPSIKALAAADALMHLSWHDSFGFAALEAMASGLPVVCTRYAGASEIIEDGTSGFLVEPDHDEEVLEAIRMLATTNVRSRMGVAAAAVGSLHGEATNFADVLRVLAAAHARSRGPIRV